MENLQEPILQILYKYSKLYHPEDLQHFARLIGRLTELRTLNHNHSEILSIWKTKDSKLAILLSQKWNLYSHCWNFRMLWFVLNFLHLNCLLYHYRVIDLKNMNRIAMLNILPQNGHHQGSSNFVEYRTTTRGTSKIPFKILLKRSNGYCYCMVPSTGNNANRVLTWGNSTFSFSRKLNENT